MSSHLLRKRKPLGLGLGGLCSVAARAFTAFFIHFPDDASAAKGKERSDRHMEYAPETLACARVAVKTQARKGKASRQKAL